MLERKMRNEYRIFVGNLEERNHLEEMGGRYQNGS
jgi:hypothetical protein